MKTITTLLLAVLLPAMALPPQTLKPKRPDLPKAYKYIPSGVLKQEDQKDISIAGFYMYDREVTNLNYREFLYALEKEGRTEDLQKARVQPEGWKSMEGDFSPLAESYHTHPAYENYPVVNITHEAALMYCNWLEGVLQAQNPDFNIGVRLPTAEEWMYAASGGIHFQAYPHGFYLRNAKGCYLYNFRVVGDESIHTEDSSFKVVPIPRRNNQSLGTGKFGPAPSSSYFPNNYGLYNMCGNVAEMLAEPGHTRGGSFNSTGYDIRIDGPDTYEGITGPSPYIGFRPVVTVVGNTTKTK